MSVRFVVVLSSAMLAIACTAQDRRTVTEPHIPATCKQVPASLTSRANDLADTDEDKLDTARLQAALDHCPAGQAVELTAQGHGNAFLAGPFSIPTGVTLLIDRGVTLFASRDPKLYERKPGSCGLVNDEAPGCKPLIAVHNAPHAAVMGEGTIDGRGGDKLLHRDTTWWDLAEQARAGGRQQVPRILVVDGSDDFTMYRITLKNSPNFHVTYGNGKGFTAWGIRIDTPRNARNTDGIDPGGSATDITVAHSFISTGDDNIAIKGSGSGVQHMSVLGNHFYAGHGMSIGSETFGGVSDILVRDLTLDGADNGIRIKSNIHRGGLVERVLYDDVCIRNNKQPITLDTRYDNPGPQSNLIPAFRDIRLHNVTIGGGGKIIVDGVDPQHSTQVQFDGVALDNLTSYSFFARNAQITYGPHPVNFRLIGDNVNAFGIATDELTKSAAGSESNCNKRFLPFPTQSPN